MTEKFFERFLGHGAEEFSKLSSIIPEKKKNKRERKFLSNSISNLVSWLLHKALGRAFIIFTIMINWPSSSSPWDEIEWRAKLKPVRVRKVFLIGTFIVYYWGSKNLCSVPFHSRSTRFGFKYISCLVYEVDFGCDFCAWLWHSIWVFCVFCSVFFSTKLIHRALTGAEGKKWGNKIFPPTQTQTVNSHRTRETPTIEIKKGIIENGMKICFVQHIFTWFYVQVDGEWMRFMGHRCVQTTSHVCMKNDGREW